MSDEDRTCSDANRREVTQKARDKLQAALEETENDLRTKEGLDPVFYGVLIDSLRSQIASLDEELEDD